MDAKTTNSIIVKISMAMDSVFACEPSKRDVAFAGVSAGMVHLLAELESISAPTPETKAFTSKVRIYLRALKTYPAANQEWLEVFWAFQQLFDRWAEDAQSSAKSRQSTGALEAARLRANRHLVFKTEEDTLN